MRTCFNCGSEVGLDDVFCGNCGNRQAPSENREDAEHGSRSASADESAESATVTTGTMREAATQRAVALGDPREPAQGVTGTASALMERPQLPAPANTSTPDVETLEQRYQRQTRNATVFIAVIVGIVTVLVLIGVIWTTTTVSNLNSQLNGGNGLLGNSNCESQGGTNPTC